MVTIRATNPILCVSDVEASIRYYVEKLGFAVTFSWGEDDGPVTFAGVQRDGFEVMLCRDGQGHPGAWFMDHRPLWATTGSKSTSTLNLTLQGANRAAGNTVANDVDLILSGHVHALGLFTVADGRPAQILAGGGGVKLTGSGGSFAGLAIDGSTFTTADVQTSWGYVQFDRPAPSTPSWTVTYQELGGSVWKTCTFAARTLSC